MRKASLYSKYLVLALGLLVVVGCTIDNLTGPISVNLGETATYSMRLLPGNGGVPVTPVVAMDVPIGWTLTSNSYTGTANGVPVSGSGTVVESSTCNFSPATSAGYQRIFLSTATIQIASSDSATLSVTFLVGGAPGNYTLSFWLGSQDHGQYGCQYPATTIAVSVTPAPAALQFYSVTPCRQLDTRSGLPLAPGETLTVPLTGAPCGLPSSANAVSVNLTVTQQTAQGFLTIYPADQTQPLISNINFKVGPSRANNANLLLSSDGTGLVNVYNGSGGTAHVILDVNGFFQ